MKYDDALEATQERAYEELEVLREAMKQRIRNCLRTMVAKIEEERREHK